VAVELAGRIDVAGLHQVTWVPTTAAHRRRRGADQAEVLATAVARRLGLPCRSLLLRLPGPPQHGRGAADRRLGPPLAARSRRVGGGVLVVDDVITSGGSVAAAARALRSAGACRVVAAAAARTPPPRGMGGYRG
jgi:predicted amidophosphoribosyltransferase